MRVLVLGGTRFLGRHIVDALLRRDHEVTLFNRGTTNPGLFPEVERRPGDRTLPNAEGLSALDGGAWDAAIDTCGYVPRVVRASAGKLADSAAQYVFISSISVYSDFARPGIDERYPTGVLGDETVEEITGDTYGPLKALCERAAEAEMPGRVLNVRPGLIVGPYDPTDRFSYWPVRAARGGEVLAPGEPDAPVQVIDARDLAAWIVDMVETRGIGVFNATGPDYVLTMRALLAACGAVSGGAARFTWVPDSFLIQRGVQPYSEMPLWVPADEEHAGFSRIDCSRAEAAGLTFRPVGETIRDTLAWHSTERAGAPLRAGLAPEREAELLAAWHAEPQSGRAGP